MPGQLLGRGPGLGRAKEKEKRKAGQQDSSSARKKAQRPKSINLVFLYITAPTLFHCYLNILRYLQNDSLSSLNCINFASVKLPGK